MCVLHSAAVWLLSVAGLDRVGRSATSQTRDAWGGCLAKLVPPCAAPRVRSEVSGTRCGSLIMLLSQARESSTRGCKMVILIADDDVQCGCGGRCLRTIVCDVLGYLIVQSCGWRCQPFWLGLWREDVRVRCVVSLCARRAWPRRRATTRTSRRSECRVGTSRHRNQTCCV